MRRSIVCLSLLVAIATPAVAADRSFPVGGFDRVSSSVPVDVRVRTGGAPGVHASGPQEMLDRLRIEVRAGELVIGARPGGWSSGWRHERSLIEVSVPSLRGAALSGPGDLTIDRVRTPDFVAAVSGPGDLAVGRLEARQATLQLSGPGNITLAGHADRADMHLSGPGDIRAAGFTSREAMLTLSGPGDITTGVTGLARGTLSGPGDITIHGGARCQIARHGPGDVRCG